MTNQANVKIIKTYANHPERQVLNYLRSRDWIVRDRLPVPAGERLIMAMEAKSWITLRSHGTEIRITDAGEAAVRSTVPVPGERQRARAL